MVPFSESEPEGEPTTLGTEGKKNPERIALGNWCLLKALGFGLDMQPIRGCPLRGSLENRNFDITLLPSTPITCLHFPLTKPK